MMPDKLDEIKNQKWFYEFDLPDGTQTESYIPKEVREIHLTRERVLRQYLKNFDWNLSTALDVSCHEGFFSLVLAEYFQTVIGLDKNTESLKKAAQITEVLKRSNITFVHSSIENWSEKQDTDFVLCFGLLYHVENPIQIIRRLAEITKKTLCIETQVLPFNLAGHIEDGSYLWQRKLEGTFGLCVDYSEKAEGGLTDLSLVASKETFEFLLRQFGFKTVNFYKAEANDYEQFSRNHRVIIFAEK